MQQLISDLFRSSMGKCCTQKNNKKKNIYHEHNKEEQEQFSCF